MPEKKWVEATAVMLEKRAMSSVELERVLKPRFRHAPNARTIANPRFRKIGEADASSLYRAKSHKVKVWGLRSVNYEDKEPYGRL
jgi:hypothetical protein